MKRIYLFAFVLLLFNPLKSMTSAQAVQAVDAMDAVIKSMINTLSSIESKIDDAIKNPSNLNKINDSLGEFYTEVSQISVKRDLFERINGAKGTAKLASKKMEDFTEADAKKFLAEFKKNVTDSLASEIRASKLKKQLTDYK